MPVKKKILVIDDDQAVCDAIAGTLKKRGHEVYTETHHQEGIERAGEILPDLIFISLLLNTTNGLKVSREIHCRDSLKKVPLVMLISRKGELDPKYTRTIGVIDVLIKPLIERDIIAKTEDIFGAAASRDSAGGTLSESPVEEEVSESSLQENCGFNRMTDGVFEETTYNEMDADLIGEEDWEGKDGYEAQLGENDLLSLYSERSIFKRMKVIAVVLGLILLLGAGTYQGLQFFFGVKKTNVALSPVREIPVQITDDLQHGETGSVLVIDSLEDIDLTEELPASPASVQDIYGGEVLQVTAVAAENNGSAAWERPEGRYSSQFGFFGNKRNAEALVEKMKQKGYDAFLRDAVPGKENVSFRVLVGNFESRKEALEQAEVILRQEGLKAVPFQY